MKHAHKNFFTWKVYVFAVAVAVAGGILAWTYAKPVPETGMYNAFALCLAEKQVVMYGAYWCPHCQNQKKAFGSSFEHIPYVECAIRGQREQARACTDAGIKGFPTWVFADGSRIEGEMSLKALNEKTECLLP